MSNKTWKADEAYIKEADRPFLEAFPDGVMRYPHEIETLKSLRSPEALRHIRYQRYFGATGRMIRRYNKMGKFGYTLT